MKIKAADWLAGLLLLAALLAVLQADPGGVASRIGNIGQDWLLVADKPPPANDAVLIIDIDRESLRQHGPWPWPRSMMAKLVQTVIQQSPRAVGIDIAFVGKDRNSPAALARSLAEQTGRSDIASLAGELADGDALLAKVLLGGPSVLGLIAEPDSAGTRPPGMALSVENGRAAIAPWVVSGVTGPDEPLLSAATGTGILSIGGDEDGVVRSLPLIVLAGEAAHGSLSLEMLRMVAEVGTATLDASTGMLALGTFRLPLGEGASLMLQPVTRSNWPARTIPAADILAGKGPPLGERIVLIGGSAPELGVLRATAADAATPSVQIHADALSQLLAGNVPQLVFQKPPGVLVLGAAFGLLGLLLALWLSPLTGLLGVLLLSAGWLAGMHLLLQRNHLILPVLPLLPLLAIYFAMALTRFIRTFRQERALRARFAERLAPGVVDRIIANPALLKLEGSQRDITVLFTDIEGFTALTERLDPRQVIRLLDRYMERVGGIVVAHGGMIDKIVGDAVHAIFNAPLDLDDHASRAIRCAEDILKATRALEAEADIAGFGLGRTRIGIETGPAVVGDVGGKVRLDYTAHGNVINTAARLEAANKELNSSICIGPIAASRQQGHALKPLGRIAIRGLAEPMAVFTLEHLAA